MPAKLKCVYIVDDDESVRRALGILLSTYGYSTTAFSCAEDFIRVVANSTPGCLLLDIHLPGLNGWQVQQQLATSGSKRPVIFITSDEDGGLMKRAFQSGAVGYLQKPFKDHELVEMLRLVG